MPGVGSQGSGCGMVPGNDQHIRIQAKKDGQGLVYFLDDLGFGFQIAVLPIAVSFFYVDEEEIIFLPVFLGCLELTLCTRANQVKHIHANQA